MAASACEIILAVVIVIILCVWYYTSMYRSAQPVANTCYVSGSTSATAAPSGVPLSAASAAPIGIQDGFSTLESLPSSQASMDHIDSAGLQQGEHDTIPAPTNSSATSVGELNTFAEAPQGVSSTMWASGADGNDEQTLTLDGARRADVNPRRVEQQISSQDSVRRNRLGGTSYMDTTAALFGVPTAQPTITNTAGVLNQSPYSPMAHGQDEMMSGPGAMSGAASYGFRTMNQHTDLQTHR